MVDPIKPEDCINSEEKIDPNKDLKLAINASLAEGNRIFGIDKPLNAHEEIDGPSIPVDKVSVVKELYSENWIISETSVGGANATQWENYDVKVLRFRSRS